MNLQQYQQIASQYGQVLVRIDEGRCGQSWSVGHVTSTDGAQIWIGLYPERDEDIRDISFFHELAHVAWPVESMQHCTDKFDVEAFIWAKTFGLAAAHSVHPTAKTVEWAINNVRSYVGYSRSCGNEYAECPRCVKKAS